MKTEFLKFDFKLLQNASCSFERRGVLVLAYLDDVLVLDENLEIIEKAKQDISSKLPVTDCGEVTHF